mmetsp:Transcript_35274/g.72198  ORF Transcript_35274/g.72198 Transcript_35274/m.72198 type:complete len:85 (-) Transcript_35274:304-558(-)
MLLHFFKRKIFLPQTFLYRHFRLNAPLEFLRVVSVVNADIIVPSSLSPLRSLSFLRWFHPCQESPTLVLLSFSLGLKHGKDPAS